MESRRYLCAFCLSLLATVLTVWVWNEDVTGARDGRTDALRDDLLPADTVELDLNIKLTTILDDDEREANEASDLIEEDAPWLLVRSYNPSQAACKRMVEWALQVHGHASGMTISLDITLMEQGVAAQRLWDAGLPSWVEIHEWRDAEVKEMYPVFEEDVLQKHSWKRVTKKRALSLGWAFHASATNAWYQKIQGKRPSYVWVFEDDVGFSGDLSVLFAAMKESKADLLAHNFHPLDPSFFWRRMVSDAFNQAIPLKKRLYVREHVERFSARFLDGLHDQAANHGIVAWSEVSIPSICQYLNMTIGQIDKNYISVQNYGNAVRITESEWNAILTKNSTEGRNKLYHALKY